jgi:hypothetical protein
MTRKTQADGIISAKIIKLMGEHMAATGSDATAALRWAFDKALGAGAYDCFASDVYDAISA